MKLDANKTWGLLLAAASVLSSPAFAAEAADVAAQPAFAVMEYRVLGNSVLPAQDIERLLYPMLGGNKTIADVEAARQQLEALYRDRGFGTVYVDIPEQSVEEGIVRLRATEGRLDRIRVTGSRYFSNGRIRAEIPALQAGEVVNLPELQAQLANSAGRSPDRGITPILKAGRTPGTVDMELRVQDTLPLHGSVELNNRYSANTTQTRASFTLNYDNLFQRYHSLSLQYQTSPEDLDETRVLAATYLARLANAHLLAVHAVRTNSDFAVVNTGGDLGVLGNGTILGARYIVPLAGDTGLAHSLTFGADYKDFTDNIVLPGDVRDTTPIRYLALSLSHGVSRQSAHNSLGYNLTATLGLRPLSGHPDQFSYKRLDGKSNFFHLRGDASLGRVLWRGSELQLRAAGQWSLDPLISNEQFSTGGADGVRGYVESALLADRGLSGSVELLAPSLRMIAGGAVKQLRLYGFFDAGYVHQLRQRIEDNAAYDVHDHVMSTGFGLRLVAVGGLEAALDWAYPLDALNETLRGDSRLHFRLRYSH